MTHTPKQIIVDMYILVDGWRKLIRTYVTGDFEKNLRFELADLGPSRKDLDRLLSASAVFTGFERQPSIDEFNLAVKRQPA